MTSSDFLLQEGLLLHRQGALGEAAARYTQVIKRDRKNLTAHRALGSALQGLGRLDEALTSFARAAALNDDPIDHHHHAAVLMLLERYEEAIASLDRALARAPTAVKAHVDRAQALHALEHNAEALAAIDSAIALEPSTPKLQIDRSTLLYHVGRLDDALAALDRAAALKPDDPDVLFNRGFFALLRSDWAQGWRDYEHRPSARRLRDALPHPRWNGEADGTVVLHAEQGLGDTMQFVRFAAVLAARGHRVVVMGPPKLKALISTAPGVAAYVSDAADLRRFEPIRWLPLMSVPFAVGITPDTVPHAVPYLAPDPARVAHWRERIGAQGYRIGINWQGKVAGIINPGRSFPLAALAPVADLAGVRLISLQKGADAELAASPLRERIETLGPDLDAGPDAFSDTAAAMQAVDLVVTCDTSIAHLAGALARPTFVALKAFPEWRFMLDRDDSPWYPTMRLFRQRRPGEWDDVFARIAAAIGAR